MYQGSTQQRADRRERRNRAREQFFQSSHVRDENVGGHAANVRTRRAASEAHLRRIRTVPTDLTEVQRGLRSTIVGESQVEIDSPTIEDARSGASAGRRNSATSVHHESGRFSRIRSRGRGGAKRAASANPHSTRAARQSYAPRTDRLHAQSRDNILRSHVTRHSESATAPRSRQTSRELVVPPNVLSRDPDTRSYERSRRSAPSHVLSRQLQQKSRGSPELPPVGLRTSPDTRKTAKAGDRPEPQATVGPRAHSETRGSRVQQRYPSRAHSIPLEVVAEVSGSNRGANIGSDRVPTADQSENSKVENVGIHPQRENVQHRRPTREPKSRYIQKQTPHPRRNASKTQDVRGSYGWKPKNQQNSPRVFRMKVTRTPETHRTQIRPARRN